jgi:hypothetical protein
VLVWVPVFAGDAEVRCAAPRIAEPAADAALATSRPAVRWEPVSGAAGYRVQVTSRVPEGAVIASLDTLTSETAFEPPQPLADLTAVVRVTVSARCGPETGPETNLRFFIDTRLACPAVTGLTVAPGASAPRLTWTQADGAQRYEVFTYAADDGRLLERGETRAPSFDLPRQPDTPAVAVVRPRCRDGYGAFAFAAY